MGNPRLVILDVGHGNCAVITDNDRVVIIDAGPGSSLLEYVSEEGIRKINAIVISHADRDHIEGILALLSSDIVKIDVIKLNSDALKGSALWDDLVWQLRKSNADGKLRFEVSLTSNDTGSFGAGGINIEVLAPSLYLAAKGPGSSDRRGRTLTSNSISAVIRLSKKKKPLVLFTGDIDSVGLGNIQDDRIDISASVLIFPHHGGKPGKDKAREFANLLIRQVKPDTVVFSTGRSSHNVNPLLEIVNIIREFNPATRIMCTQLSRFCASLEPHDAPHHLHPKFARGRETRSCCAGSIVIDLDHPNLLTSPEAQVHNEFINANAPNAMCRVD